MDEKSKNNKIMRFLVPRNDNFEYTKPYEMFEKNYENVLDK
jgi:hypothetical protein